MERNDYKADFDPIVHLTEWYSDPSSPTDLFSGLLPPFKIPRTLAKEVCEEQHNYYKIE